MHEVRVCYCIANRHSLSTKQRVLCCKQKHNRVVVVDKCARVPQFCQPNEARPVVIGIVASTHFFNLCSLPLCPHIRLDTLTYDRHSRVLVCHPCKMEKSNVPTRNQVDPEHTFLASHGDLFHGNGIHPKDHLGEKYAG